MRASEAELERRTRVHGGPEKWVFQGWSFRGENKFTLRKLNLFFILKIQNGQKSNVINCFYLFTLHGLSDFDY